MDAMIRRMLWGLAVFLLIGTLLSMARGDSVGQIVAYALAGIVGVGFLIACRLYALRR
jgi:hypothetical protein